MKHTSITLPYERNALEPYMSEETLNYHYGKHHQTYVQKLNELIIGTPHEDQSLEEIITSSEGVIFNNAAQVWNHDFFWNCLTPHNLQKNNLDLDGVLTENFGSFEAFREAFTASAIGNFGSGWTWLAQSKDLKLSIINTSNAGTLVGTEFTPLLVVDVWEHAYYIDTRNARPAYLENFWKLVDWDALYYRLQK